MKKMLPCSILLLLLLTCRSMAQDLQNCLLWRISGNNIHTSYLFGTIHLQDRRVFNLPDSLYAAIDQSDVFSLEVNADSLNSDLSAYYSKIINEEHTGNDKKLEDVLDKEELKTLEKSIDKGEGINAGKLTTKQAFLLRERLLKPEKKADDMPTFLDAYLYMIAKDKGRQIAGLERLEDQMALLDDQYLDFNPHDLARNLSKSKKGSATLVDMYLRQDLLGIQDLVRIMPVATEEKLLGRRNHTMLHSMDSIMQLHSLFAAVGAAHLPGVQGLIALLRKEGYTVEPVFCKTYTHASTYTFKNGESNWVTVPMDDAGYSVRMPGVPSSVDAAEGILTMKIYVNLATSETYTTCHLNAPGLTPENKDSLMDVWSSHIIQRVKSTDRVTKDVSFKGMEGRRYTFSDDTHTKYRIDILNKGTELFLLMTSTKNAGSAGVDTFYNSFRFIDKSHTPWQTFTSPEQFISARVPGGKISRKFQYNEDSSRKQIIYTIRDIAGNSIFYISVNTMTRGYDHTDDSVWVESVQKSLSESGVTLKWKKITGFPYKGDEYYCKESAETAMRGQLVYRGNRIYNFIAEYPDNAAGVAGADTFFNSVQLIDFPPAVFTKQSPAGSNFTVMAPEPFTITRTEDSADAATQKRAGVMIKRYNAFDEKRLINFVISEKKLSPYYWNEDDTVVLRQWLTSYTTDNDSITNVQFSRKGNLIIGDAICHRYHSKQRKHLRVIGDGRTRYVLIATYLPAFAKDDPSIDQFFSSFTIIKPGQTELKQNPGAFFTALHSTDSSVYHKAVAGIDEVYFTKADVPVLLHEVTGEFMRDTARNIISTSLFLQLKYYKNNLSVPEVAALYDQVPAERTYQKFAVLALLGRLRDSVAAYSAIKQLMLAKPPRKGSFYELNIALREHQQLTKSFFPDWLQLAGDSVCGNGICALAHDLADSGILDKKIIIAARPQLIGYSRQLRAAAADDYSGSAMMYLLSADSSREAWEEIKQYQFLKHPLNRYNAVELLLGHNITPDKSIIDSLAANDYYRTDIYTLLEKNKKTTLFPVRFLNQRSFAQSSVCSYANGEEFDYCNYLDRQAIMYKGKMQQFYLFEVKESKDATNAYLGVAGPYSPRPGDVTVDEETDVTGIYDELLNKKELADQLKTYLQTREEQELKKKARETSADN